MWDMLEHERLLWDDPEELARQTADAAEDEPAKLPQQPKHPEVPAVALMLSREAAAESLSMSVDTFDAKVKPHIRVVSVDRRVRVPVRELERWVNENAAFALQGR